MVAGCAHTRDRSYCIHSSGGLCRIPFDYLLFKRDLIKSSIEISLIGFIQRESDGFYLYRSEEEATQRNRVLSLLVTNAEEFGDDSEYLDRRYVFITGTLQESDGDNWAQIRIIRAPSERASYIDASQP